MLVVHRCLPLFQGNVLSDLNTVKAQYSLPTHQSSTTLFSAYGSLWTEICYYMIFLFTTTFSVPPQIEVDKQWHYIGVWLYFVMVPVESFYIVHR